jgi:glycosyltransferase involved in cell wall biosynthesis
MSRILCLDVTTGFPNIVTHRDAKGKPLGASQHQLFFLLHAIATKYENDVYYFKRDVTQTQRIDGVTYMHIQEFDNFPVNPQDVILMQRFVPHNPQIFAKIQNNRICVWLHDLVALQNFTGIDYYTEYYMKNREAFKQYIRGMFTQNPRARFIFPSEHSKGFFIKFLKDYGEQMSTDRLHVIYNILYESDFVQTLREPSPPVNLDQLVFASSWSKNIEKIIELFGYIHANTENYKLVFMEHGWDRNPEFDRELKVKFGDRVQILGPQTKAAYNEIIRASLCTLTSTAVETFGCVFSESYYLGTPVIADYRSGGTCEIVDHAYVLDYDKPREVLEKLDQLREERNTVPVKLDPKFLLEANLAKWQPLLDLQ